MLQGAVEPGHSSAMGVEADAGVGTCVVASLNGLVGDSGLSGLGLADEMVVGLLLLGELCWKV